ncbi:hypothetical protein CEUSTIGMA_g11505.t1 [Chlamydomonas eustigma]|uniref:Peptidase S49 domain-containing protein n=1 Tax=Chlamydomonas eustigma TaxID=1157962 RepID=A0A250XLV8_9CHLO|nr:hypothetical protein CEUSTIGMA_g11505.t1 [Chlamydomonas eustigma]|eukprot:GAX84081.1 hypothetical protein CEUSTIGMA_g11505.t1 [Chlamydomonas eustigma]
MKVVYGLTWHSRSCTASFHVGHKSFTALHLRHSKTNQVSRRVAVACSPLQSEPESAASVKESTNSDDHVSSMSSAASNTMSERSIEKQKEVLQDQLVYREPSATEQLWTKFKLGFALPWRRFKPDSVLVFKLEGDISDQGRGRFDPGLSVPQICQALQKAALDPRVKGLAVEIGPLQVGWAKVQEIRRYLKYFRQSGKFMIAYMKLGGEKEYYLASAFEDIYTPPSASLSLRGFAVTGTFLRGVLEKVGVEPQVKRIGKYKSAGDQLLRKDMSEPQAEQLNAILEDINEEFLSTVSEARGKSREDLVAFLEEGVFDMKKFVEGGWVTALKYEDEVIDILKEKTEGQKDEELKKVEIRRYNKVSPSAFGLKGKKRIVVLRTSGAIVGRSSGTSSAITPDGLIPRLKALAKDKSVAAVVLRVDSPGGDALASDLMWREIRKLGERKPVVASMGDVAASGGYYLSMACKTIVAEPLTITGSIGVVTGKFNLAEFYEKIGYNKTILSKGRYAELLADNRPFSQEEQALFDNAAQHAYESFRDKAAMSRGMEIEAMQEVAQGRVWTGAAALQRGLVDALGGVNKAVAIAKQLAEIPEEEKVTVSDLGRVPASPLALLGLGASLQTSVLAQSWAFSLLPATLVELILRTDVLSSLELAAQLQSGGPGFLMTDVNVATIGDTRCPSSRHQSSWNDVSFMEDSRSEFVNRTAWVLDEFVESFFDM